MKDSLFKIVQNEELPFPMEESWVVFIKAWFFYFIFFNSISKACDSWFWTWYDLRSSLVWRVEVSAWKWGFCFYFEIWESGTRSSTWCLEDFTLARVWREKRNCKRRNEDTVWKKITMWKSKKYWKVGAVLKKKMAWKNSDKKREG